MLYALRHPPLFAGLLLGFLAAVFVRGYVQALVVARLGDAGPRLHGRLRPSLRHHLDPYGSIAAALAGPGWSRPVELLRPSTGRLVIALLCGSLANLALAAAGVGVFVLVGGHLSSLPGLQLSQLVHGDLAGPAGQLLALGFAAENVAVAALAFFPMPPLESGRAVLLAGGRSRGWQRARYELEDRNWGVVVVLVLLLLPLGGRPPLILYLLDLVIDPLINVL